MFLNIGDENGELIDKTPRCRTHYCIELKRVVKKIFQNLLKDGDKSPLMSTSRLTEMPVSTVHKIVNTEDENLSRKKYNGRKSAIQSFHENEKEEIRKVIHGMYERNIVPTSAEIKIELQKRQFPVDYSERHFKRLLHSIGFAYKTINKRLSIMETERLRKHRVEFIRTIRQYRNAGRNIVYLDETWFDTHEVSRKGWIDYSGKCVLNIPPARGKRVIILHAGNENGWINNCLLLSAKNIINSSADYHQDMDAALFENWFGNTLLPNLPPNSVIVMDNASYHSRQEVKIPNTSSKKEVILNFLKDNKIRLPEKQTKKELLLAIKNSDVNKSPIYAVDTIAKNNGHTVLRLPPYYCILNPIEMVWSQLKHFIRKANQQPHLNNVVVEVIRQQVGKTEAELWRNCIRHVIKVEDSFLGNENFPEFIINLNDESDSDDDEDDLDIIDF